MAFADDVVVVLAVAVAVLVVVAVVVAVAVVIVVDDDDDALALESIQTLMWKGLNEKNMKGQVHPQIWPL